MKSISFRDYEVDEAVSNYYGDENTAQKEALKYFGLNVNEKDLIYATRKETIKLDSEQNITLIEFAQLGDGALEDTFLCSIIN